jgi:hypothetical protein
MTVNLSVMDLDYRMIRQGWRRKLAIILPDDPL